MKTIGDGMWETGASNMIGDTECDQFYQDKDQMTGGGREDAIQYCQK